ncbi:hypothetical protein PI125_g22659 [Phytophthora idaei]|nr:hypothetical protein PI125_g22659 [Phytophthora idaei]
MSAGDWRPLPTTEIPNLTQKLVLNGKDTGTRKEAELESAVV